MAKAILKYDLKKLGKALRIVGEERRLRILCALFRDGKLCVTDAAKELKMSVAVASHHLRAMEREKLLKAKKDGRSVYYVFTDKGLAEDLKNLICRWKQ